MGKLKDTLIEEVKLRGYSERTQEVYVSAVEKFIIYSKIKPSELTLDHVRKYKLHQIDSKLKPRTINQQISAIKFFFVLVLKKQWDNYQFRSIKVPRKLPVILSKKEIVTFLNSADDIAHKTIFMTMYSCGLRRYEVAKLKAEDIDSKRMLFPSTTPDKHYNPSSFNRIFKNILKKTSITKNVSCHSLRHSWATHMLEEEVNLRYLQVLLGHSNISSTAIYTHLIDFRKVKVKSPLDLIANEIKKGGTNGN